MSSFSQIDLSKLPAPEVIETLDYERVLAEIIADLSERYPALAPALSVETEPAHILAQAFAYRELILRARINDSAKAVMLPYASGADLDALGAGYNVARLVVSPGDPSAIPPIPEVLEGDDAFRARIQLAFEGLSTAGPRGAYRYHALSADGRVKDVSVVSPAPTEVVVTVLSEADGAADAELLAAVDKALNSEDVRPLTDMVNVQSAQIVNYTVEAVLTLYEGPDGEAVMAACHTALGQFIAEHHRLGHDITISGLHAALHQPGVQKVELISPASNLVIGDHQAAYCEDVRIRVGGRDA